jgi:hypothetical protein
VFFANLKAASLLKAGQINRGASDFDYLWAVHPVLEA